MSKLCELEDTRKMAADLAEAYPEPQGLTFLNPEPLGDVEAHLRASKMPLSLPLLTRPLAEIMSYLEELQGTPNIKVIAERLSDMVKCLAIGVRLTETTRIDLVCQVIKVPVLTAQTEKGISLLGSHFARNVDRLRKDEKVLVGEDPPRGGLPSAVEKLQSVPR